MRQGPILPLFIFQGDVASQDMTILCSPLHIRMSGTMVENKTLNLELRAKYLKEQIITVC